MAAEQRVRALIAPRLGQGLFNFDEPGTFSIKVGDLGTIKFALSGSVTAVHFDTDPTEVGIVACYNEEIEAIT